MTFLRGVLLSMRIMGLDMGSRTIGVALSDPLGMTAQPVKTIKRTGLASDLKELSALILEFEVGTVVVGLPIRLDGSSKADMSRAKRKKVVDKLAACYILQGYLDHLGSSE
jgi:putative Holliday junction resolvase